MRYRKTNRCYRPAHTERMVRYWSTYINPEWDFTPQMRTIEELCYIKARTSYRRQRTQFYRRRL